MLSLQEQFNQLHRSLVSFRDSTQRHRDTVSVSGTSAIEQGEFCQRVNGILPIVRTSSVISEMTAYWQTNKPTASYDVLPDLVALLGEMETFQLLVVTSTPKDTGGWSNDMKILLDDLEESELGDPHVGPHIVSWTSRQYNPTQATNSGYIPQLDAMLARMAVILDS